MPKRKLYRFIAYYLITIIVAIIGYILIEDMTVADSVYHTIMNVVAFGGVSEPVPLSQTGKIFTIIIKLTSLYFVAVIAYSALQSSILERVDRITHERIKLAKKKPIKIFVSYRRSDSSGHTGRIYDRLSSFFGTSNVFMDIDTIAPGEDFLQIIQSSIASCDLVLAVIGKNWTGGEKRIFNEDDFVRIEIAFAIENNIQIIPILVNGAKMPATSDVPSQLIPLLGQHAIELSDLRWNHDIQKLIDRADSIREKIQ